MPLPPPFVPEPNPNAGFYAALKNELANSQYTGLSHQQMVDLLNAMNQSVPVLVPYAIFQPFMMQQQCWGAIRVTALKIDPRDPAQQAYIPLLGVCLVAIDLLTKFVGNSIDVNLAAFKSAMGALVQAGLVKPEEQAAIMALGQSQTSRALQLFNQVVTVHDIDVALA